jgi:outer membrane protein
MFRYIRTFGVLTLALAVTVGPVAPAFGQNQQQTPPPNQAQVPPPAQPPTVTQGGPPPAPPQPKKTSDAAPREYSHGNPAFPNLLAPYKPIKVPNPNMANSQHLSDFISNGKMSITVQDAIALALENSLDIEVERYVPWIAQANLLASMAGAGNPGGLSFDPTIGITGEVTQTESPVVNPLLSGTGTGSSGLSALGQHNVIANFSYNQGFVTGTNLTITQSNTRSSSTESANIFNPYVQSTMSVTITQSLLNGFGLAVNTRFIKIAHNTVKMDDLAFKNQVITTVTAVQNDYWQLVYAIQNIAVAQRSVAAAKELFDSNSKQAEIGTMAPLDVTTAKAQLATAQTNLINAQTARRQSEEILLAAITRNPLAATMQNFEIVPTDNTYIPEEVEKIPLDQALREALANRPDYQELVVNLDSDDLNIRATKNLLLPTLNVTGRYGWTGLAGTEVSGGSAISGEFVADLNDPIVNASGTPIAGEYLSSPVFGAPSTSHSGLSTALNQVFTNQFPNYAAYFTLTVPIRNRAAQGASAAAILQQRQDLTNLQRQQNAIVVAIREAQIALEQARATLTSAIQSRELQDESLAAEIKKLNLGVSTSLNVITIQNTRDLAAGAEVQARVALVEAKVNFDNVMGRTFSANAITVADTKHPNTQFIRDAMIPGTHADGSLTDPQN